MVVVGHWGYWEYDTTMRHHEATVAMSCPGCGKVGTGQSSRSERGAEGQADGGKTQGVQE